MQQGEITLNSQTELLLVLLTGWGFSPHQSKAFYRVSEARFHLDQLTPWAGCSLGWSSMKKPDPTGVSGADCRLTSIEPKGSLWYETWAPFCYCPYFGTVIRGEREYVIRFLQTNTWGFSSASPVQYLYSFILWLTLLEQTHIDPTRKPAVVYDGSLWSGGHQEKLDTSLSA